MALLALDLIPSLSDPRIIVKAIDKLQDFDSKVYNKSLKKRSVDSYFKKQ